MRTYGLWLALALLPSSATADVATPEPAVTCPPRPSKTEAELTRAARDEFVRGTRAYHEGQYEVAASAFQSAYCLVRVAPTLFNIGQSYRQAGKRREALRAYRAFLAAAPDSPQRAEVERQIASLE